jgi:hypothetical protein
MQIKKKLADDDTSSLTNGDSIFAGGGSASA